MRTNASAVQSILGADYQASRNLVPYMTAAGVLVDAVAACCARKNVAAVDLAVLEAWVAAHMYCQSDRQYTSRSELGASGSFAGQYGMYMESTSYGQTALMLDTSGCLRALSQGKRARALWLGKPASEQIPLEDRD